MNVLIFGAGAVGLGLASTLIKTGHRVDLFDREITVNALNERGLERIGIFGEFSADPTRFTTVDALEELSARRYDFILICTKSFDSPLVAQQLQAAPFPIDDNAPDFVLCQNGWGNAEVFAEYFPRQRIHNARIITGFCKPRPHQVEITVHADAIHLGSLLGEVPKSLSRLSDAIHEGGIPCEVTPSISRDLWAKMLYNCMLNGLSTLFDAPYGLLGESPHTRELMESIAREVFGVMSAAGYDTHWSRVEDYLETFYKQQLPSTYRHEPSMLQDIRAKRRTEIEALNGAVAQLGKRFNVPVPSNRTITQMILFLESRAYLDRE